MIFRLLLPLIFSCSFVHATSLENIKIATTLIPPYYNSTDGKNVDSGPLYDLVKKVVHKTGINYSWKQLPAKRLYSYLKSGDVDIFGGITELPKDVKNSVIFTNCTLGNIDVSLVSLKNRPKKESLRVKKIGLIRGLSYLGFRAKYKDDKTVKIVDLSKQSAGLKMLDIGRIDSLLIYSGYADSIIPKGYQVETLKKSIMKILISKRHKQADLLREKLDLAISKTNPSFCK